MICDVIMVWRYVCMSLYTDYIMAISRMDLVQTKSVASKTLQTYFMGSNTIVFKNNKHKQFTNSRYYREYAS